MRVVMMSNRNKPEDVVAALELGADDFIGKPFAMREFVARVGACLRRPPAPYDSDRLSAGGICVDKAGHRVLVDGRFGPELVVSLDVGQELETRQVRQCPLQHHEIRALHPDGAQCAAGILGLADVVSQFAQFPRDQASRSRVTVY